MSDKNLDLSDNPWNALVAANNKKLEALRKFGSVEAKMCQSLESFQKQERMFKEDVRKLCEAEKKAAEMVNKLSVQQKFLSDAKKSLSNCEAACAKVAKLVEFQKKLQKQEKEIRAKTTALKHDNQNVQQELETIKWRHATSLIHLKQVQAEYEEALKRKVALENQQNQQKTSLKAERLHHQRAYSNQLRKDNDALVKSIEEMKAKIKLLKMKQGPDVSQAVQVTHVGMVKEMIMD